VERPPLGGGGLFDPRIFNAAIRIPIVFNPSSSIQPSSINRFQSIIFNPTIFNQSFSSGGREPRAPRPERQSSRWPSRSRASAAAARVRPRCGFDPGAGLTEVVNGQTWKESMGRSGWFCSASPPARIARAACSARSSEERPRPPSREKPSPSPESPLGRVRGGVRECTVGTRVGATVGRGGGGTSPRRRPPPRRRRRRRRRCPVPRRARKIPRRARSLPALPRPPPCRAPVTHQSYFNFHFRRPLHF